MLFEIKETRLHKMFEFEKRILFAFDHSRHRKHCLFTVVTIKNQRNDFNQYVSKLNEYLLMIRLNRSPSIVFEIENDRT